MVKIHKREERKIVCVWVCVCARARALKKNKNNGDMFAYFSSPLIEKENSRGFEFVNN